MDCGQDEPTLRQLPLGPMPINAGVTRMTGPFSLGVCYSISCVGTSRAAVLEATTAGQFGSPMLRRGTAGGCPRGKNWVESGRTKAQERLVRMDSAVDEGSWLRLWGWAERKLSWGDRDVMHCVSVSDKISVIRSSDSRKTSKEWSGAAHRHIKCVHRVS